MRPDPGFGESPEPPEYGWSATELAADIGLLLDALKIETCHLIGAKYGGSACMRLAIDQPRRLSSLCLFGSPVQGSGSGNADKIREKGVRQWAADTMRSRLEGLAGPCHRFSQSVRGGQLCVRHRDRPAVARPAHGAPYRPAGPGQPRQNFLSSYRSGQCFCLDHLLRRQYRQSQLWFVGTAEVLGTTRALERHRACRGHRAAVGRAQDRNLSSDRGQIWRLGLYAARNRPAASTVVALSVWIPGSGQRQRQC